MKLKNNSRLNGLKTNDLVVKVLGESYCNGMSIKMLLDT